MTDEDREIAETLRGCREPARQRYGLVLGLIGAFACGGVVFLAVARLGSLRGWAGGLLAVAVIFLLVGYRRAGKRTTDE